MSDKEVDEDDIEILRQKNIEEKNAFLSSLMTDPFFAETVKAINAAHLEKLSKQEENKAAKKRKRGEDSIFRFTGAIPRERRSSARLQSKKPEYSHLDLPEENQIALDNDSVNDLEEVVYQVKRSRKSSSRAPPPRIIPVEEVTEEMIANIQTSGNKVYDGPGSTSCHQCRQKTVDTKTICRSGFCVGIRGQFCGICVINRYGEDPVAALKDPNWQCYVCRGCCNCSFCRLKQGKRPTGILAPLAKMNGFKSVKDFLSSLKGYGDYAEPHMDPENLRGFRGNVACMGGSRETELKCDYDIDDFRTIARHFIKEDEKPEESPGKLLGFEENAAVMSDRQKINFKCDCDSEDFKHVFQKLILTSFKEEKKLQYNTYITHNTT